LRALFTAGEKGEAMAVMVGERAIVLSVMAPDVDPGVTARLLSVVTNSSFPGISALRSIGLNWGSGADLGDLGDESLGVADDHGGAGGCVGGCEVSRGVSGSGASGSSSGFDGSEGFGSVISASLISTLTVGSGVGSFSGVSSLCLVSDTGSVEISIAEGSSSGGDGGNGEGLLDDTSLRAGDLISILTDVDRIRSRCNLSSWACCRSLRLNESGGLIWRG